MSNEVEGWRILGMVKAGVLEEFWTAGKQCFRLTQWAIDNREAARKLCEELEQKGRPN